MPSATYFLFLKKESRQRNSRKIKCFSALFKFRGNARKSDKSVFCISTGLRIHANAGPLYFPFANALFSYEYSLP